MRSASRTQPHSGRVPPAPALNRAPHVPATGPHESIAVAYDAMSYLTSRWPVAAVTASLSLGAVACGGDADQAVDTGVATTVPASPSQLLDVDGFVDFVGAEPSAVLVNVHVPYEGHIDGTDAFVAFDEIGRWDDLPAELDAPIALYCRSGNMSAQATDTLVELGYTNIVDLEGGMNAWTAAGNQLQTSR